MRLAIWETDLRTEGDRQFVKVKGRQEGRSLGLGGLGAMCDHGATVWRSSLQTLLVDEVCDGPLGLLPDADARTQGSTR